MNWPPFKSVMHNGSNTGQACFLMCIRADRRRGWWRVCHLLTVAAMITLGLTPFLPAVGEKNAQDREGRFFRGQSWKGSLSYLFTFYWLELSHMATSNHKGVWEM